MLPMATFSIVCTRPSRRFCRVCVAPWTPNIKRAETEAMSQSPHASNASLTLVLLDVGDGVAHRADLLGVFVRNVDLELLFEREHKLHDGERVGAEIIDERCGLLDLGKFHIELLR